MRLVKVKSDTITVEQALKNFKSLKGCFVFKEDAANFKILKNPNRVVSFFYPVPDYIIQDIDDFFNKNYENIFYFDKEHDALRFILEELS